jgi:hypothetical protein
MLTLFRKLVTVATGYTWGSSSIVCQLNSDGSIIYPTLEKVNATTFYLYMPVDNVAVDVYFH